MDPNARAVARALARVYDVPFLQTHPLAAEVGGGKALQRRLLEAVEQLGGRDAQRGRAHRLLTLRYLEGLAPRAVQRDLGLARSQYFEEHARAVAAVASMLAQLTTGAAESTPARTRARSVPNNLPAPVTSFVGREPAIAELAELLGRSRLVTLTGAGGIGKTRLALQVAAASPDRHPDGAWFVDLAPLGDDTLVIHAVLAAVGLSESRTADPLAALVEHLRGRRTLVLLDNCEHLLPACAHLADALLRGCPNLRILATSRELLGIPGELAWRVPSLSLPPSSLPRLREDRPPASPLPLGEGQGEGVTTLLVSEAVQLFVDRANLARPGFAVTDENAPAVLRLCQQLDGIPLAIELACARLRAMSVQEIAARLDEAFGLFRLLTGGSRTALPRHQTLRALIDWSHALLAEAEQTLFRRLAAFAGGWTLEAAETICADAEGGIRREDVLDLLTTLVDKSLVVADERDGATRYRPLETIRQYAQEKLVDSGEDAAVRRRHAEHFLALAERADPMLDGPEQVAWLDRLEAEHDNLRAALRWLVGADDPAALRLAAVAGRFWLLRGLPAEARQQLTTVLAMPVAAGRTAARARLLLTLNQTRFNQGDYAADEQIFPEALAISREVGDRAGEAHTLLLWGGRLGELGIDYGRGRAMVEESLAIFRELGDRWGVARAINRLGLIAWRQGDVAGLRACHGESLAIMRELGSLGWVSSMLDDLANAAWWEGDLEQGWSLQTESLSIRSRQRETRAIAVSLDSLAGMLVELGRPRRALRIMAAVERARAAAGIVQWPGPLRTRVAEAREQARQALDQADAERALAEGRAITIEDAVADALRADWPDGGPHHTPRVIGST